MPFALPFYAGAPLRSREGLAMGSLCVIDTAPRELTTAKRDALAALGRGVVAHLELRRHSRDLKRELVERERAEAALLHRNQRLADSERETKRLLGLAQTSRGALLSVLEDQHAATRQLPLSNRSLQMLSVGLTSDPETATSGTLGLQLVRDLARQIGGRLECGSGPGTTFAVTFALTAPRPAAPPPGERP